MTRKCLDRSSNPHPLVPSPPQRRIPFRPEVHPARPEHLGQLDGVRGQLSKSEMEVVRIVWDLGDATVRQVHESLAKERDVDFKTVQTYLRRLESKGYLRTKLVGKNKVYSARVPRGRVIRRTVEDFVGRLFAGETLPSSST